MHYTLLKQSAEFEGQYNTRTGAAIKGGRLFKLDFSSTRFSLEDAEALTEALGNAGCRVSSINAGSLEGEGAAEAALGMCRCAAVMP